MTSSLNNLLVRALLCYFILYIPFLAATAAAKDNIDSLPSNLIELDLVFPREGGRYAETPIGLPVIFNLQNPTLAYHYGWGLSWTIRPAVPSSSSDSSDSSSSYEEDNNERTTSTVYKTGSIGSSIQNNTKFDSPTHLELESTGRLPKGRYTFSWVFGLGPWCEYLPGSAEYLLNPAVSRGSFEFAVEEEAPTPTFTGTCPTPVGMVGFETLTTWHGLVPSLDSPTGTTMFCAVTSAVDEKDGEVERPCLATVEAAVEKSVSSRMGWGEFATDGSPTASSTSVSRSRRLDPLRISGRLVLLVSMGGLLSI